MASIVKRGEIWMVDSLNEERKGSVMRGFRPAVIISNDLANISGTICTVVPLTSNAAKGEQSTHVVISNENNQLRCSSIALCEQPTTVNKDQVRFCLGRVEREELKKIDRALLVSMGICIRSTKVIFISLTLISIF